MVEIAECYNGQKKEDDAGTEMIKPCTGPW